MELQTTSQTPITPTPPNRASRDSGNRRESWGLGIVLTNSDNDLDFEHAAATMGLMTTNYYPQDASGDNSTVALPSASRSQQSLHKQPGNDDQQNNSAFSFFGRLANSISALVSSNNNDADEDLYLPLDSKSQIEDMLESYYLSQGRPVPEWVNKPPPDPPMSIEVQKTSSTTIDRSSQIPVSSDRSSSKSNSQGVISRSFARLNFAKITRPQISFGIRGSSASASENSNAENTRRSAHDSGFNSPLGPDPQGLNQTPSISVQMVDELSEPRFNTPTDSEQLMTNTSASRSTETFQLDSDQLAASVSASDRESSPGYFSPRWFHKSPKTAPHRNRTVVDRWLRSEDKQNGSKKQASTPISLSSLMPQSNGEKTKATRNHLFRTGSHQSRRSVKSGSKSLVENSVTPIPIKRSPLNRAHDDPYSKLSSSADTSQMLATPTTAKKPHSRGLSENNVDVSSGSKGNHSSRLQSSADKTRNASHDSDRKHDSETSQIYLRPPSHSRSKSATNNSATSTPVSSRMKRLFRRKSSHS